MKRILSLVVLMFSIPAIAAITVTSPKLSPATGEYEVGAKLVDEHSHTIPTMAVLFPDSSGHSGIASVDLFDAGISPVTGKQMPIQYKLASGQKIPIISLVGLNLSTKATAPFTFPSTSLTFDSDLDVDSNKIVNVSNPTSAQDAATKAYVDKIAAVTCSASAGGAATEALTCTGLVATDTVLAVTQKTPGANNLPLLGWSTLASNAITGIWSADPGANAVVEVLVKHL